MASGRRWLDWDILAKVGGGAALLGVSFALWSAGRIWPWGWIVGGILLLWGVLSIGDAKRDDVV